MKEEEESARQLRANNVHCAYLYGRWVMTMTTKMTKTQHTLTEQQLEKSEETLSYWFTNTHTHRFLWIRTESIVDAWWEPLLTYLHVSQERCVKFVYSLLAVSFSLFCSYFQCAWFCFDFHCGKCSHLIDTKWKGIIGKMRTRRKRNAYSTHM